MSEDMIEIGMARQYESQACEITHLKDEIERLRRDGPTEDFGARRTDGTVVVQTMREALELARAAARSEALAGDDARRDLAAAREGLRDCVQAMQFVRRHLYAASTQTIPGDDTIISRHIEDAYRRIREVLHEHELIAAAPAELKEKA